MQEVVNPTCLERFADTNDPVSTVRLLPDLVVAPSSRVVKSLIVEKQNDLLHEKYAGKVAEYDVGFRAIVSEINQKLISQCKSCNDYMHNESLIIKQSLLELTNCVTTDCFLEAWENVSKRVTTMFININELGEALIHIERERLQKIKGHLQEYYVDVHDHCYSDRDKLSDFFANEISEFNSSAIKNYQLYSTIVSRLKINLVQQFYSWHNKWELILFSWRDCVTKENINRIQELSKAKEFLVPEELEKARDSCLLTLEHAELSIDAILDDVSNKMPISIDLGVQTFDKIGNIFAHCQETIIKYHGHLTRMFDGKFCKLAEHIGEMRGYLISNSIFEENKSLQLFEYSIYSICEEFEKRIADIQKKYTDEISTKCKLKEKICAEIKEYTFRGCNAWGLYLQGYEFAYNDFVYKLDHGLKSHNNNVSCLEKSLNKSCTLLAKSRTMKLLDKRFEEVTGRLEKIYSEYVRYENTLENKVESYVKEWVSIEKILAQDLLTVLNIKVLSEQVSVKNSFEFEGKNFVFQGDCSFHSLKFKLTCSRVFVEKLSLQNKVNLQDLETKLAIQIKQAQNEVKMRRDLHLPRLSVTKREIYDVRAEEITDFNRDCDAFWNEITRGEQKFTSLFQQLSSDTDKVIKNYKDDVEELKLQMNQKDASIELIKLQPEIKQESRKRIGELNTLIDEFEVKISEYKAYMHDKHNCILSISEEKFLKMNCEARIKNEFDEFAELAEDMKTKAEAERQKVVHIQDEGDKALSHYKHTIFCVFYIEKKKEILKECRLQIKTASVSCCKEVVNFENEKKAFTCQTICSSLDSSTKLIKEFEALHSSCKRIINMVNYSSGIGENLAQCVSMDRLRRRYKKFDEGQSRSMDSVFLKEIVSRSSAKNPAEQFDSKAQTREEFSWRIPRIKVHRELIGKSLTSCRYGVAVKPDLPASDHNLSRTRAETLKRYGLEARSENYWAAFLLGKRDTTKTKEEHDSIVAKACAKLRDRKNSRVHRKSFAASLPLLKQANINMKPSSNNSGHTSPVSLPSIQPANVVPTDSVESNKSQSSEQIDMDGAVRLSRTVEFLMGPHWTRKNNVSSTASTVSNQEKHHDFLVTPDETMKKMIFQSSEFFGFKKRCLDVNAAANQIVSIPEKSKYFLRNAFEQFVLSSEVFYRQKNMLITKKAIPKDIDTACKEMENDLQLYLTKVERFCADVIKKMKDLAHELISQQEQFITSLFKSVSNHLECCDKDLIINVRSKFETAKSCVTVEQTALLSQLTAHMCHPNYHDALVLLQSSVDQLNTRYDEQLSNLHADAIKSIEELHAESLAMIEKYKTSMYGLADVTVHPSKVKRITRGRFKGVEHWNCLQDHMPGDSPRKLHQLFLNTEENQENGKVKQQTKFYDHIAMENARAVVHVNTWYQARKAEVNVMFENEHIALKKWLKYWDRNIKELTELENY